MHLQFIEPAGSWTRLLPLTYTRPVADLRVGILKIYEKWVKRLNADGHSFKSESYLSNLYDDGKGYDESVLQINSSVLPGPELIEKISALKPDEALYKDDTFIAGMEPDAVRVAFQGELSMVNHAWDIFRLTKQEIELDFDLQTAGRISQPIKDPYTRVYGDRIFLEEGASVRASILNAEAGAIYLSKNSTIHEGALIKGSFYLGENSQISMGAKMRGDTTIGPRCKVGGEVSNSVFQGLSNKSHDGFLGNSVIGEWCNIGADSNNSNLKNNYANVKMWDFQSERFQDTGLQFCGLIMGDHSKCGINTMFNTGTTIGVSANIFGCGFPRNIVPSFAWGGASGFSTYQLKKAMETAKLVFQRRGQDFTKKDTELFEEIFRTTSAQRIWEKDNP